MYSILNTSCTNCVVENINTIASAQREVGIIYLPSCIPYTCSTCVHYDISI